MLTKQYNIFRWYRAGWGRYTQADLAAALLDAVFLHGNAYTYTYDRPITLQDRLGLNPGDLFSSRDDAARDALRYICPMCRTADREYGGWIFRRPDGTFSYTAPLRGQSHSVNFFDEPIPPQTTQVGSYHCHGDFSGNDDDEYSYNDKRAAVHLGTPAYLATPWGHMKRFDPAPWVPGEKPEGSETPLGNCNCRYWDKDF